MSVAGLGVSSRSLAPKWVRKRINATLMADSDSKDVYLVYHPDALAHATRLQGGIEQRVAAASVFAHGTDAAAGGRTVHKGGW